jgi:hypothetical protein
MNSVIGIPKIGCLALQVNRNVYKLAEGNLSLEKTLSEQICLRNKSKRFPQYYRSLH